MPVTLDIGRAWRQAMARTGWSHDPRHAEPGIADRQAGTCLRPTTASRSDRRKPAAAIDLAQVDGRRTRTPGGARDFALGLVLRVMRFIVTPLHPCRDGLHRVVLAMHISLRGLDGGVAQHLLDHCGRDPQVPPCE